MVQQIVAEMMMQKDINDLNFNQSSSTFWIYIHLYLVLIINYELFR